MNEKIIVLLVEPQKAPCLIEIENSSEALYQLLEGELDEYTPFEDDVAIVCSVCGKQKNQRLNRTIYSDEKDFQDVIFGTFLVCYAPIESEKYLSFPDGLAKKYADKFKNPNG